MNMKFFFSFCTNRIQNKGGIRKQVEGFHVSLRNVDWQGEGGSDAPASKSRLVKACRDVVL